MAKYEVYVTEMAFYRIEIEADSEEEAYEAGIEIRRDNLSYCYETEVLDSWVETL